MGRITVLLVDDHAVVRQGLHALIECETDMEVVGEAADGHQAISMVRETQPEVILMDVSMPGLNGVEATRQILKGFPETRVLALTSYGDEDSVTLMTQAGARGYVTKQTAANDLLRAIREVRRGNQFYSPAVAKHVIDRTRSDGSKGQAKRSSDLTLRESQVLQLIAEGFSNKEIGCELNISVKTVEKHRQSVMNKLNIHEVASLTRYAISKGVVSDSNPA